MYSDSIPINGCKIWDSTHYIILCSKPCLFVFCREERRELESNAPFFRPSPCESSWTTHGEYDWFLKERTITLARGHRSNPMGYDEFFFFLLHSAKYNDTSRVVGYVETCTFYGASLRLGMAYARTKPFGRVSRSRAIILHIFYSKFIRRPGRTRRRRNFENVCVAQRFYYVNGRKNVAHTHGSHLWWRREERKIK